MGIKINNQSSMSLSGILISVLLVLGLTACGGGESTTENPVTTTGANSSYSGPAPATADVQSFRLNVWENLNGQNRCGACHVIKCAEPRVDFQGVDVQPEQRRHTKVGQGEDEHEQPARQAGRHSLFQGNPEQCTPPPGVEPARFFKPGQATVRCEEMPNSREKSKVPAVQSAVERFEKSLEGCDGDVLDAFYHGNMLDVME